MPKLCNMDGVRGGEEDFPVELWQDDESGRLIVRGINEGGFACVDIDLLDLCGWLGVRDDVIAAATRKHCPGR